MAFSVAAQNKQGMVCRGTKGTGATDAAKEEISPTAQGAPEAEKSPNKNLRKSAWNSAKKKLGRPRNGNRRAALQAAAGSHRRRRQPDEIIARAKELLRWLKSSGRGRAAGRRSAASQPRSQHWRRHLRQVPTKQDPFIR